MSHYVFHPYHEAIVVSSNEYQKYLDAGWYDSPAKFPSLNEDVNEKEVEVNPIKKKGRPPKNVVLAE